MNEIIEKNESYIIEETEKPVVIFKTASKYLEQLTGELSENTKRAYITDIKQFFGVKNPSEITLGLIRSITPYHANVYLEELKDKGMANATINRKMQALSKFYRYLCRRDVGVMDYNPFDTEEGASRLKVRQYSNTRSLTDDEVSRFVSGVLADNTIIGLRNKIIIFLLITAGMRRGEIVSIDIGQIAKTHGKYIVDFTGKGHKNRFVVIADSIKRLIDEYIEARGLSYMDKNAPLFVSHSSNADPNKRMADDTVYNIVKRYADEAGIDAESISPHCFRHTYITMSINSGCDLEDIADRVGHSNSNITRRYDHTERIIKDNPADMFAEKFM